MRLLYLLIPLGLLAAVPLLRPLLEPRKPDEAVILAAYAEPLPAPEGPLRVYHLGHSLVGRDMPAMLAQLAPEGHGYESQLGWGTSLNEHWLGGDAINGFEAENAHPRYRDAKEAIGSGEYDAVVMTEMVELKDAIRYHHSARALHRWADLARKSGPDTRIFLYETWHHLDDTDGWLQRLDRDLPDLWEGQLILPELALADAPQRPIYLIPAGQVMASFVRKVEEAGGIGNVAGRESLFARTDEGAVDTIHVNDIGAYLVALTHYAVLYQQDPTGLPFALARADGTPAAAPDAIAARAMQETVWEVVRTTRMTGMPR